MKTFFKKIWAFILMLVANPEQWNKNHVLPSIEIVENIKRIIDSGLAMAITSIIPGTWDDSLRVAFSSNLKVAIQLLTGVADLQDTALHKFFVQWLNDCTPDTRKALYKKLASLMANENAKMDGGGINGYSSDLLVQLEYAKNKSKIDIEVLKAENTIKFEFPENLPL